MLIKAKTKPKELKEIQLSSITNIGKHIKNISNKLEEYKRRNYIFN